MNRSKRNWLHAGWAVAAFAAIALTGCDFLDPTQVDNPATTVDDLAAPGYSGPVRHSH
jgi:hypothetical protein